MTIDVRAAGFSLAPVLSAAPKIDDQLNAVCRTLTVQIQATDGVPGLLGKPIELWYKGKRWFYGFVMKNGFDGVGNVQYTAYDPLFYLKRHEADWYFKQQTATQIYQAICARVGIKVGKVANTGAPFPYLHYQKEVAEKVAIDVLARTIQATGKKYWYRFDPDVASFGFTLFERTVPSKVWAFQSGVNLTAATYEESVEDMYNVVRLVNRETGKVVTKEDGAAKTEYGQRVYMEEVDKDEVKTMDAKAAALLKEKSQVKVTMRAEGINPDGIMPQFFSGDVVYLEEDYTQLIGAYHIANVTHTFLADNLIELSMDVQRAPEIPPVQIADADKKKKK
jgi:hypothetical protein